MNFIKKEMAVFGWTDLERKPKSLLRFGKRKVFMATMSLICCIGFNTAMSQVTGPVSPDNIIEANCLGTPPSFQWGIRKAYESTVNVSTEVPFVVGDIDGDGKSEIVAFGSNKPNPVEHARTYYPLYVFSHEGQRKLTLKDRNNGNIEGHCDAFGSLALVKLPDPDSRTLIIAANAKDRLLYAYDQNGIIQWVSKNGGSDQQYYSGTAINLGVTDFNCDGWPEIYIGNSIFDAQTGQLLVTIPGGYIPNANAPVHNSTEGIFYVAADVLNLGYPQLILGCRIFRVNITSRTGTSGNSIEYLPYNNTRHGGHVSIADFDNDGYLDIFVTKKYSTSSSYPYEGYYQSYLWNPQKSRTTPLPDLWTYDAHQYKNIPMIGDIDGDGQVEVVFFYRREGTPSGGSTNKQIVAYKYNISGDTFSKKWELDVDDDSGSTGLTMFDFNQDGRMELVYRDEYNLRIIDGNTKNNLAIFACSSLTGSEYPIIADIDGDGEAEIIVTGAGTLTGYASQHGNISIYKSGTNTKWAPARSVWNQYAYNSVNVNNDLTIPQYPFNPATTFSGGDCPSFNGVRRPFNGFLQQQTLLNQYGCPLWILPKIEWVGEPTLSNENNTITFTATIINTGEAGLIAPIYITTYKNSVSPANVIQMDEIQYTLYKDQEKTFHVVIENVGSIEDLNKIIVNVNDKKEGDLFYQQCNVMASKEMNIVNASCEANNVFAVTYKGMTVDVNVLFNDLYPCTDPILTIGSSANGSSATEAVLTIASNTVKGIRYTPAPGFVGRDIVTYTINCNGTTCSAQLIVAVLDKEDPSDCVIDPFYKSWGIREAENLGNVAIYDVPKVADLNGDGYPEILVANVVSDHEGYQWTNRYVIYDGKTHQLVKEFTIPGGNSLWMGTSAVGKVNTGANDKFYFFVAGRDGFLKAFNLLDIYTSNEYLPGGNTAATPVWSTKYESSTIPSFAKTIFIADFNNDGYSELLIGNQIYDAAQGTLLIDGTKTTPKLPEPGSRPSAQGMSFGYFSQPSDVTGDGKLNYIVGNSVYDITINSDRSSGTATKVSSVTLPAELQPSDGLNGYTVAADMNNDGRKDIVVITTTWNGSAYINVKLYIWDVEKKEIMASVILNGATASSIPFIGDIDGDGRPEIVFITGNGGASSPTNRIYAYKYIDGNTALQKMWEFLHSDYSCATGITLFDFNQDGIPELIYRDLTQLRIINGSLKSHITGRDTTVYDMAVIGLRSETGNEYPVIADLDNDGEAEILIGGLITGDTGNAYSQYAPLRIYKSTTFPWAPARSVWNQFGYHVTNVNDDLTIPRYQINAQATYPGPDGIVGTADDIRPFNNFLQQSTTLNSQGIPFFEVADLTVATSPSFSYAPAKDSVMVTMSVKNQGAVRIVEPWHITTFKVKTPADSLISVATIHVPVEVGETKEINFYLPISTPHNIDLKMILNFKNGRYVQPECDTTNNTVTKSYKGVSTVWEIWNWQDLSQVKKKQDEGYTKFKVMQNIGIPGQVETYGDGTGCTLEDYVGTDRIFGWYGYEGFVGNGDGNDNDAATYIGGTWTASPNCGWQTTVGWIPLGSYDVSTNKKDGFTQEFDGNNKKITGMWIKQQSALMSAGLFGCIDDGAIVKDLGVVSCNIEGTLNIGGLSGMADGDITIEGCYTSGTLDGMNCVGGLVGTGGNGTITDCYSNCNIDIQGSDAGGLIGLDNGSIITNCYATGDISGSPRLGGLVGSAKSTQLKNCYATGNINARSSSAGGFIGLANNGTIIEDCYASGNVTSTYFFAGGFIGTLMGGATNTDSGITIRTSYAIGNVTISSDGGYAGGFIGNTSAENPNYNTVIENCYATGYVSGSQYLGGFIGESTNNNIYRCYATGAVMLTEGSTNTTIGGFAGTMTNGSVINCYYDEITTTMGNIAVNNAAYTKILPLTTTKMIRGSNFTGFDFISGTPIWTIEEGMTYPYLTWQTNRGVSNTHDVASITYQVGSGAVNNLIGSASVQLNNNIGDRVTFTFTNVNANRIYVPYGQDVKFTSNNTTNSITFTLKQANQIVSVGFASESDIIAFNITGGSNCPPIVGTIQVAQHPTCGASDGSIRLFVEGNSEDYTYLLNGNEATPFVDNSTGGLIFNGLGSGYYTITATNTATGCEDISQTLALVNSDAATTVSRIEPLHAENCLSTGSVKFYVQGAMTYQYKIDEGSYKTASTDLVTESNLSIGDHFITIKDVNGCENPGGKFTIRAETAGFTFSLTEQAKGTCAGGKGLLRITYSNNATEYRLNDGLWLELTANPMDIPVLAGIHTVELRNANSCIALAQNVTITNTGSTLTAGVTGTTATSCGWSNGTISLNISGDIPPYEYSYDGGMNYSTFNDDNEFIISNLEAGVYDIIVRSTSGDKCPMSLYNAEVRQGFDGNIAPPRVTSPQRFCEDATVGNLQAEGIGIKWYEIVNDAYVLRPSGFALEDEHIYYAVQSVSGCESTTYSPVKVIIDSNTLLEAPDFPGIFNLCGSGSTLADIPTYGNTNIVWYDAFTGGSKYNDPATVILENGHSYFAAQSGDGTCAHASRTEVIVTIGNINPATPVMETPQQFCEGALVGNLAVPNNQIVWYSAAEGGVVLSLTMPLIDGGVYYAAQKAGDCESATRTAVTVKLTQYLKPDATDIVCVDGKKSLADIPIIGAGVVWYAADGNGALPLSTNISTGETYLAAQTNGDCESERIAVTLTNGCYNPRGTIFPFVHIEDEDFDNQFITTVALYTLPPANALDKINYVKTKSVKLFETAVIHYNDTTYIAGTPKNPGMIGFFDNPGNPILWRALNRPEAKPDTATVRGYGDLPTSPIGQFEFKNVASGQYVIEVTRQGFLTRYGVVTIGAGNTYLGHREILGGDINGDLNINEKDLSMITSKYATYGQENYKWEYDLNGSAKVGSDDATIIKLYFGAYIGTIYEETSKFLKNQY